MGASPSMAVRSSNMKPVDINTLHIDPACIARWRHQWPAIRAVQASNGRPPGHEAYVLDDGSLCILSDSAALFLEARPDEWDRQLKPL